MTARLRRTGCRIMGITVSQAQMEWARERVRQEGMEDRIDIRLTDYRHIAGRFDRIVSIEMLEAVGHRRLGTFFRCCGRLLKPSAVMALQTITIPDERYDEYRRAEERYIRAEFTSAFFRFVDDVECLLDEGTGTVHVRSASRVGYSDFGVNRRRVEEIRLRFVALNQERV